MTVKQLIELLSKLSPDAKVFIVMDTTDASARMLTSSILELPAVWVDHEGDNAVAIGS